MFLSNSAILPDALPCHITFAKATGSLVTFKSPLNLSNKFNKLGLNDQSLMTQRLFPG